MLAPAEAPPGASQKGKNKVTFVILLQFHRSKVSSRIFRQLTPLIKIRCVISGKNRCGGRCSSSRQEIESESAGASVRGRGDGSCLCAWNRKPAGKLVCSNGCQKLRDAALPRFEGSHPTGSRVVAAAVGTSARTGNWVNIQSRSGPGGFL